MPIIDLYVQEGCGDKPIADCMKAITNVIADNLENTLPRMVRITVTEFPNHFIVTGNGHAPGIRPTAVFQLGPGRSEEATRICLAGIAQAMAEYLGAAPEDACVYLNRIPGHVFSLGGKAKDFGEDRRE